MTRSRLKQNARTASGPRRTKQKKQGTQKKRDRLHPTERLKRLGDFRATYGAHGKAKIYLWQRRTLMDKIDVLTESLARTKRFNMSTLDIRKAEADLSETRAQLDAVETREYSRFHGKF